MLKSDVVFNIFCFGFGIGVILSCIWVFLAIYYYGVVIGGVFLIVNGVGVIGLEILGMDVVGGKIVVVFYYFILVIFGEDDFILDCFGYGLGWVK